MVINYRYMTSIRRSISSILTIVIFLVLAALSTVMYSGDEEKKAEMENNLFYQKTRLVFDTVFSVARELAEINLDKNIGFGKKIKNQVEDLDLAEINWSKLEVTDSIEDPSSESSWLQFMSRFKNEWQNSQAESNQTSLDSFFSWQRTEQGMELIFRPENEKEYRLPVPLKLLKR